MAETTEDKITRIEAELATVVAAKANALKFQSASMRGRSVTPVNYSELVKREEYLRRTLEQLEFIRDNGNKSGRSVGWKSR